MLTDAVAGGIGLTMSMGFYWIMGIEFGHPSVCVDLFSSEDGPFWLLEIGATLLTALLNGFVLSGVIRFFILSLFGIQRCLEYFITSL